MTAFGMMRKTAVKSPAGCGVWLAALIAACLTGACSETPPPEPAAAEDLFFQEIIQTPGVPRHRLFEGAKLWVSRQFSGELDVIQYANRDQGVIMAKTFLDYSRPAQTWGEDHFEFRFGVFIETREGRMRVTFKDMSMIGVYGPESIMKTDMDVIRPMIETSVANLKASLAAPTELEDW